MRLAITVRDDRTTVERRVQIGWILLIDRSAGGSLRQQARACTGRIGPVRGPVDDVVMQGDLLERQGVKFFAEFLSENDAIAG